MSLEREVKLQAPATFRMPDLGDNGLAAAERAPLRLVTTYVDTADLRVARWGCSLRHRNGEGWTVKLPASEEGSLIVRPEHVFDGDDPRRLPRAASDLLRAYVRGAELSPVARVRTVRRGVDVSDELGRPVAVVTDDEVSVMDGRRVASRFRELEIELTASTPAEEAEALLGRLREAGAGPVDNVPKVVRALGARATEPPDVVVNEVDEAASVAEVLQRSLAASVLRLFRHDAGVRLGEDPEAVHQARVATRRLRSDLRIFRDVVEPSWEPPLREELRWLGGLLGGVRDAEVLGARLRSRESLLAPEDVRTLQRILAELGERRAEARDRLVSAIREPRYVRLLDALVDGVREPQVLAEAGSAPAASALRPTLEGSWKHLKTAAGRALDEHTDEALHAARIRAKRIRYAAEAAAPVFGKRAVAFAEAAATLQDVLGEHQDAVVAVAWLREHTARSARSLAFVGGRLAEMEAASGRAARDVWPPAWKALSRKRLRFWT